MIARIFEHAVGVDNVPLAKGHVLEIRDGQCVVRVDTGGIERDIIADILVTSADPVVLAVGHAVLCFTDTAETGIVLGRIGGDGAAAAPGARSQNTAAGAQPESACLPDTLVLEATKALTLRVGDGSITIRDDGRILIKGKDLVSHAKRNNRIRGGSVTIN